MKEQAVFSAAHFITFNGNICERLHGHNYRVAVDVGGPLDENHYVFDFIAIRDLTVQITQSLDHHMLLPTKHPQIIVKRVGEQIEARFEDRLWSFPAGDCVLLDIPNTTAELLAEWIGHELMQRLKDKGFAPPHMLRVHVEENFGQWGKCEWTT